MAKSLLNLAIAQCVLIQIIHYLIKIDMNISLESISRHIILIHLLDIRGVAKEDILADILVKTVVTATRGADVNTKKDCVGHTG